MDAFIAAVVTLGVAVIGASIVYQVVTHPTGTTPIVNATQNITDTTVGNLFK